MKIKTCEHCGCRLDWPLASGYCPACGPIKRRARRLREAGYEVEALDLLRGDPSV